MLHHLLGSELFLKAQTDERLMALCREGHTPAFGILVDRHRRALLGHACRMVGSSRGEDVLQQALLNAWRSLQDGREVRNAQAWLHRIVHNSALTEIERQPHHAEALDTDVAGVDSVASVVEQRDELRQMLHGLAGLPDRERLALLGSELDGRSRQQLADELGLSEGAVRQLVYRARQRMRAGLAVLIPFPFLLRAGRAWARAADAADHLPGPVQAAGGSGLIAGGGKAATVTLVVGAIGGAAVLHVGGGHPAPPIPPAHAGSATRVHHATRRPHPATPAPPVDATIRVTNHRPAHAARPARPRRPSTRPTAIPPAQPTASTSAEATPAPEPTQHEATAEATPRPTLHPATSVDITKPKRPERATTAEADTSGGTSSSDAPSRTSGATSSDGGTPASDQSTTTSTTPTSTTPTTTAPSSDATTPTDTTSATTSASASSPITTAPTSTTGSSDG